MVTLVFAGAGLAVVALMGGAQGQQCGTVVAPVGDGSARLPVVGPYVVTSEFGMRFHPTEHVWKLHKGIDLAIIGNGGQVQGVERERKILSKREVLHQVYSCHLIRYSNPIHPA